jgi:hypothetical protein
LRWLKRLAWSVISVGIVCSVLVIFTVTHQIPAQVSAQQTACLGFSPYSPAATRSTLREDLNPSHLRVAQEHGLSEPLQTRGESIPDELLQIENNENIRLKSMGHSRPFLTPEAVALIDEIGRRFRDSLAEDGLPEVIPYLSSALRSEEEQRSLRTRNGNAAVHSAHMYGTTFDLSYNNWYATGEGTTTGGSLWIQHPNVRYALRYLRRVRGGSRLYGWYSQNVESLDRAQTCGTPSHRERLRDILVDLRQEGRLLALEEYNQPCFHVTVRG